MSQVLVPIGTKAGEVILQGGEFAGEEWDGLFEIDHDLYRHFGQIPNQTNFLLFTQVITGHTKGTCKVKGKYNSGFGITPVLGQGILVDNEGIGWIGYNALHGLTINYTILAIRQGANVDRPGSGIFEFDLQITDALWSINGPIA